MSLRLRGLIGVTLAGAALAGAAAPAWASFHLVKIREVYPGSVAAPGSEYVELQSYATGQNLVAGHAITLLDSSGAKVGSASFPANVANGADQATMLAATPAAEAQFGIVADAEMPAGRLDPAGGAVCWESIDCVAWGGFHGSGNSPTGMPVDPMGIPDGMSLRRTIAPGCATLLEAPDDRDDSAMDFFNAFPSPRSNSVAPAEHACASQEGSAAGYPASGGGNGGRRRGRPRTRIRRRPGRVTRDRTPTFRFTSSRRDSTFFCRLDRRRFRRCRSPFTTWRLGPGRHVFQVKARAPGGAVDRSPARWRFRIVRPGRHRPPHRPARPQPPPARR